jgi:hypothetical protein
MKKDHTTTYLLIAVFTAWIATLIFHFNSIERAQPCVEEALGYYAPETLLPPNPHDFSDDLYYSEAVNRFTKYGTWATLDDGTICYI